MRILIFALLIVLASCQKETTEPIQQANEQKAVVWDGTERKPTVTDETGQRIGAFYPLYYKESVTTDLIANTLFFAPFGYTSVGGTSAVTGFSIMSIELFTDY